MSNAPLNDKDKHLTFWLAVHDQLQRAKASLPFSSEPDRIHWSHPDDDWKNDAEVQAFEEEAWAETDALLTYYCEHHGWPKRSKNDARYFAEKRIIWARRFTRLLTIPDQKHGCAAVPRPPQSGWEFFRWLLVDAYRERHITMPEAPFSILPVGPSELGVPVPPTSPQGTSSKSQSSDTK
jgi:hypothetical protein